MKNYEELISRKNFCVLPFIHGATLTDGEMPLCCVAEGSSGVNLNTGTLTDHWNGPYLKNIRKKMLENHPIKECRRCIEEDSKGYRSHRMIENKAWLDKLGTECINETIEKVNTDGTTDSGVLTLDLRLGNTCNLQCVMCQPRESSKWRSAGKAFQRELSNISLKHEWRNKNNIKSEKFEWYRNEKFWDNLYNFLPSLRELIVGGGEPMLIKEHLEFIKKCAESGHAHHIHLRYHTNLTVFPEEMIPYWEQFERVEFFTSIDGMSDIGHYIRYPSQWNIVEENMEKMDSLGDNIWLRLLYSVNALNVQHLPSFLRWVVQKKFKKQNDFSSIQGFVHPGIVHWPNYLNIKVLPADYKKQVTKEWLELRDEFPNEPFDKYLGVLEIMNSEDWSSRVPQLYDYLRALDKTRGTDFYSVFPDLSESILSV